VAPHEADELRAIIRVRRIDAGEGSGKCVRIMTISHGVAVVATCREELAMIVDSLGDVVVYAE
jgi:hypothetical protein